MSGVMGGMNGWRETDLVGVDAEDAPAAAHDVAEAAGVGHGVRGQGEGGVGPVPV